MDDTVVSYELIVHEGGLWIISGTQDISLDELCDAHGFNGAAGIYSSDSYDEVFEMQEFLTGSGEYPDDNKFSIAICNVVEEDYFHALDEQCKVDIMVEV